MRKDPAGAIICTGCHRKTLPKEPCWACRKIVIPAARTEEGAWCTRCRQHHLAEPCSRCGLTKPVGLRREDGRPVCRACYQHVHPRPLRQCVDCGDARPASRISEDGPLCEKCDNRRAPTILCPQCGQNRKVGILSTGVCRACARQATPRQTCVNCGLLRLAVYRDEKGQPWCDGCRRADQAQSCTGCGRRTVVTARDERGPWCDRCWQIVRPGPTCRDCGSRPSAPVTSDGTPRCVPCYSAAVVPCARCGTPARAERRWPEGPVCLACVDAVRLTHQDCHRCGRLGGVFHREANGPLCPECAGVTFSYRCPTCAAMGRLIQGQCPPCRARLVLTEAFTDADGRQDTRLVPLAELLEHYDNPYSMILYLRRPGGQLIRDMVRGTLPCTHEALDALRQTTSVQHLRGLLVLAEILEPREEQLAQLKRDFDIILGEVSSVADRTILARYARWHLMPLAHQRLDQTGFSRYQREHLRRQLGAARVLLGHIRSRGRTLDSVTQHLVDRWLIANPTHQYYARPFLLWAATSELAPADVAIATSSRNGERSIMNDTDRVLTALKLETDHSLPLADRVAGCLVLQYGQSTDRIVKLTLAQIHIHPDEPGVLGLQLGREPLWLRPRLSALLQQLTHERRPLAAALKDQETPYLFPGLRPSSPLSSNTLQRRLQRLGIPSANKARNGAWLALVGAVHWKMLADLLGAADGTAHHWHKWNGGDRASYVASRLRAAQAPTGPE
ncbi:hypothetical protein [Streptomyces sp. NPDC051636]|uniref:hypothetical protein n=1 Tax=Streptomyces sp. NPDC051636 TaxID=3365663 RepID=UPI00379D6E5A